MVIPHLHFNGECEKAIALYEKAFNTKADGIDRGDKCINHANMKIHGQTVYLNDNEFFAGREGASDFPVHLIVTFTTAEELLACYDVLKKDGEDGHPFVTTPYSALVGNFADKLGIWWGFMVGSC
ncbi:MAG: VOC family protein [Defluviitaleaceae bacterium]|nr:VOC family protein [Defluviitaleaceae bacterium]